MGTSSLQSLAAAVKIKRNKI